MSVQLPTVTVAEYATLTVALRFAAGDYPNGAERLAAADLERKISGAATESTGDGDPNEGDGPATKVSAGPLSRLVQEMFEALTHLRQVSEEDLEEKADELRLLHHTVEGIAGDLSY